MTTEAGSANTLIAVFYATGQLPQAVSIDHSPLDQIRAGRIPRLPIEISSYVYTIQIYRAPADKTVTVLAFMVDTLNRGGAIGGQVWD